ncbi:MAG TPA: signal peptide peptidase SppA [Phycisphaerae bacterium]|nr:signal peptide peptidase SppA [Phycisphaerae bacterium]
MVFTYVMRNTALIASLAVLFGIGGAANFAGATATTQPAAATSQPSESSDNGGLNLVAEIDLNGELLESPRGFSLSLDNFGPNDQPSLTKLLDTLKRVKDDDSLSGVYLNLSDFDLTLAQTQELGQMFDQLRSAGKKIAIYASDFDTNTYLLGIHADTLAMATHGELYIPGVELQLMFFKGLLDKFHIQADMVQIGKFKGAEEPLTRSQASPEFAAQITGLVNSWYDQIISEIVQYRHISRVAAINAIDEGIMEGVDAKQLGLVDNLVDAQDINTWIQQNFEGGCALIHDFDQETPQQVDLSSPFALFQLLGSSTPDKRTEHPAIAVICATGTIVDDTPDASDDENDDVIMPANIRDEVQSALDDPNVKAMVLRVNSPGGSAEASEIIWQTLHAANLKKPLFVSMGDEAASGGYYISSAGREIVADPCAIVGSIGVVGGKIVIGPLLDEVGITTQTFSLGEHAGLFDETQPFSPEEREFVTKMMLQTYALFTQRVMASRGKKIADINQVAYGRLFSGEAAVKVGLVDQVGTLDDTIKLAADAAGVQEPYDIVVYPQAKTFAEIIKDRFGVQTSLPIGVSALLAGMPHQYQQTVLEMFQIVRLIQSDDVVLAAPVGFVEKN